MSGVKVDPVTLQPVDPKRTAEEKAFAEKKHLEALANRVGISQSEAASTMTAIIEEALIRRVEKLLCEDDACKTLLDVLRAVGTIELSAAQAVKALTRRQFTLTPRSAGR